ncbi:MAG: hypothetical protein KJ558_09155 [Gammaproteobacteria bacterium]|nr:hypothetical protein [Gammaproteobacteria bacterium]
MSNIVQLIPGQLLREVEITKKPFANVMVGAASAAKFKDIAAKAAPTVVLDKLVRLYFPSL